MMTLRRKILLGLLILPAATMVYTMIQPGEGSQLAFLMLGVPVLVWTVWEFFLSPKKPAGESPEPQTALEMSAQGFFMKNKILLTSILLGVVMLVVIVIYAGARAKVGEVPFSMALSTLILKIASRSWHFLTTPSIFIGLLTFLLLTVGLVVFRKQITMIFRGRKDETPVKFPETFHLPVLRLMPEASSRIVEMVDLATVQLMVEIDGIDINKDYMVSKVETLGVRSDGLPGEAGKTQKEAFYHGVVEGLCGYVFPMFCSMETKNGGKGARFSLKDGVREKLMKRLNEGKGAMTMADA
jgi:hypothetical protein